MQCAAVAAPPNAEISTAAISMQSSSVCQTAAGGSSACCFHCCPAGYLWKLLKTHVAIALVSHIVGACAERHRSACSCIELLPAGANKRATGRAHLLPVSQACFAWVASTGVAFIGCFNRRALSCAQLLAWLCGSSGWLLHKQMCIMMRLLAAPGGGPMPDNGMVAARGQWPGLRQGYLSL